MDEQLPLIESDEAPEAPQEPRMAIRCRRCRRRLKNDASRAAGIGPVCARKEAAVDIVAEAKPQPVSRLVIYQHDPMPWITEIPGSHETGIHETGNEVAL
jgi:hypothetical protein